RERLPVAGAGAESGARPRAPVVLANLLRGLLSELAQSLPFVPAHLIASGILAAEADAVSGELRALLAMRERRRLLGGEWAALWFEARPSGG
ncbi:MAG: hypothetical protein KGJ43_02575, partial [Acidobacteriota bacterium]|nr:hypothetical protein [Acidobacteriota bacterium]